MPLNWFKRKDQNVPGLWDAELDRLDRQNRLWRHPHANRQIQLTDPATARPVTVAYLHEVASRRSIGLTITAQGLRVRAPRWVSQKGIEECLHEKAGWIIQKLQQYDQPALDAAGTTLQWQHGTVVGYLGQPLQIALGFAGRSPLLQTVQTESGPQQVLHLPLPSNAPPATIALRTRNWLRQQALQTMRQQVNWYAPQMGVQPGRVALTSANTRWGSASSSGSIRLHWRLIQMQPQVLDYVVIHELAHLHEMNHSPRFWAWVERFMPDYQHWRRELKMVRLPAWE